MKVKSFYTLNLWQDPLKARALVYQFAFNITKMRWRALQRSGLFYLTSKLPLSQPTALFLLFSLFHFKSEVKVCVNICRASPPWRTSRWFHVCVSDSLSFLSLSFERNIPQGLCTHWISQFRQSKVESNVCNNLFSSLLHLLFFFLCISLLSASWQGQLPAHLMSAWRSRIMVRHGTVVIPVNRMAVGEGRAPVKLPSFCSWKKCCIVFLGLHVGHPGPFISAWLVLAVASSWSDSLAPSNDLSSFDYPLSFSAWQTSSLRFCNLHTHTFSSYFYIHVFSMSNKALKTTDHFFFFCLDWI